MAVAVLALAGCVGAPVGPVSWGACSDTPQPDGYNCTELHGDSVGAATYQAQCERNGGIYSDACPPGANPGCCTQGPDADGLTQITCSYNCTDTVCADLPAVCTANRGVWSSR
ncbi:MAG: hypothetical protein K1X94_28790 [Sandaracinaceae bacterium]|nr:hypothetical protein [Sandaracinaceae bacterium]